MTTPNAIIRTVLGDIKPAEFGICYAHEHLLGEPPTAFSQEDLVLADREVALEELRGFHECGGSAVVEMTTPDYGRDAAGLRWLAEQSGVKIVASTGHNHEKFSAPYIDNVTEQELSVRYAREVMIGMDGSAIRAGIIKASSPLNAISPLAGKMLTAATLAHQTTGAPISTHTEAGTMALEQIELLTCAGVAPSSIVIGHLDRKLEWDYHLKIACSGVFLGYDQVAKEKYYPDSLRAEFISCLFDEGHGEQILLSGDLARRSYWYSYSRGKNLGFRYILTHFVPLLKEHGMTDNQIHTLLVDNPARAFAFAPKVHHANQWHVRSD